MNEKQQKGVGLLLLLRCSSKQQQTEKSENGNSPRPKLFGLAEFPKRRFAALQQTAA
jgi:hypothetical protein